MGFEKGMLVAIWRGPEAQVVGTPVEEPWFKVGIILGKALGSSGKLMVKVDRETPKNIKPEKMSVLLPFPLSEADQRLSPSEALLKHQNDVLCCLAFRNK